MPLFNNWPWIDLSKLNLDYILSKIKVVEDAELDAQKVFNAAATILPKVDQVNSDADRAEAAANAAEASAADAAASVTSCQLSESNAAQSAQVSLGYNTLAQQAKTAAEAAQTAAETARTGAETAQTAAQTAKTGADQAMIRAEAAADRAESASSTTGYRAYAGVLAASTTETLTYPDGTYQLDFFANDSENSSGIYLMFKSGPSLTYRLIQYNGNSTALLIGSTESGNALTVRNQLNVEAYWFITGCEAA